MAAQGSKRGGAETPATFNASTLPGPRETLARGPENPQLESQNICLTFRRMRGEHTSHLWILEAANIVPIFKKVGGKGQLFHVGEDPGQLGLNTRRSSSTAAHGTASL